MLKKLCLLLIVVLMGATTSFAQNESDKETRKARKEAEKAKKEAEEMALFAEAFKALNDGYFVLEADRVEFRRGTNVYVSPNTNFISMVDEKATIQLNSTGAAFSGPNGIGGITVDGNVSNISLKQDRKGNITYNMMVQGVGVSATVTIRMSKGSNFCTAMVSPNFNGNRMNFTGYLYPFDKSDIYKGRAL